MKAPKVQKPKLDGALIALPCNQRAGDVLRVYALGTQIEVQCIDGAHQAVVLLSAQAEARLLTLLQGRVSA